MTTAVRTEALTKLAFFGPAGVTGAPTFGVPPLTVGQVMYNANLPNSPLPFSARRPFNDAVVNSGLSVNSPAKSLLRAGVGALAGNFVANALGMGPFSRGLATAIGANYGYNH